MKALLWLLLVCVVSAACGWWAEGRRQRNAMKRPIPARQPAQNATDVDALFAIVGDLGDSILGCGQTNIRPLSRLTREKDEIKRALVALYRLLDTAEGRRFVLQRYDAAFARSAVADGYRAHLRDGYETLAEFVPDSEATEAQAAWALVQGNPTPTKTGVLAAEFLKARNERIKWEKAALAGEFARATSEK